MENQTSWIFNNSGLQKSSEFNRAVEASILLAANIGGFQQQNLQRPLTGKLKTPYRDIFMALQGLRPTPAPWNMLNLRFDRFRRVWFSDFWRYSSVLKQGWSKKMPEKNTEGFNGKISTTQWWILQQAMFDDTSMAWIICFGNLPMAWIIISMIQELFH